MKREYWMDRDGMGITPKKTEVSIVDIGTEVLRVETQRKIDRVVDDIKAEYPMTTQESFQALSAACDDMKKVTLQMLGIDRVIKFLSGVPTESTGPR
jgi:hypothetical protein